MWGILITLIVIGLISSSYYYEKQVERTTGSDQFGYYSRLEFPIIDIRHRLLSQPSKADDDIVIVTLTENAIQQFKSEWGRWPWPRRYIAKVVKYLRHSETIMMDIAFLEPSGVEVHPSRARKLQKYLQAGRKLLREGSPKSKLYFEAVEKKLRRLSRSDDVILGRYSRKYGPVIYPTWMVELKEGLPPPSKVDQFRKLYERFGYKLEGNTSVIEKLSFVIPPIKPLFSGAAGMAHITFTPDPDGPARRFAPFKGISSLPERSFDPDRPYIPILGLAGALYEKGYMPGESTLKVTKDYMKFDGHKVPFDRKGRILIRYQGGLITDQAYRAYREIPIEGILNKVIEGGISGDAPPPKFFKGKHVLLGSTAPGVHDLRATPYSAKEAGVAIHANILDMFLNNKFLHPIQTWHTILAIVVISLAVGVTATFLAPMIALIITVLLTTLYFVMSLGLFNQGYLINVSAPLLSAYTSYGLVLVYNLVFEQKKRRQVRNAFEHYLTASVMEEILDDPDKLELGGERREITVLFADIAGFTSFSEGRTATEVASVINKILTEMTECIFRYEGVLDKYIGDEMVAEFGIIPVEPEDHARRAVDAAIDMRLRMNELREKWREEGHPLLQLRIGVHTGMAATGNMGSEMLFDYTALGDNVNLGSRLEGANKQYNTLSMISEVTRDYVGDRIVTREIDDIIVKGKDEPITVYELLGREGEVPDDIVDLRDRFEEGLQKYRNQEWDKAIEIFDAILDDHPDDGPSEIFIERSRAFKEDPPPDDWDGVYRLTSK